MNQIIIGKMPTLAPICLFTYNRLDYTKATVEALQNNLLASESELFVFCDGSKNVEDAKCTNAVRAFMQDIRGFKMVKVIQVEVNHGLAKSIITGVSSIINQYGKVIVLEDDLVTSPNFLDFMNQALDFYQDIKRVFSISGFTLDLPSLKNYYPDYYVGYRASSWGWATWLDRWQAIDWELSDYNNFKTNSELQKAFNTNRGSDMTAMLKNQMNGSINSWAIRWCYNQFLSNSFTVFPTSSKVNNIGFGGNATHTSNITRYSHTLDTKNKRIFNFDRVVKVERSIIKDFVKEFSIWSRIKWKFLSFLGK